MSASIARSCLGAQQCIRRQLTSTAAALFPRTPKFSGPTLTPIKPPSPEQLRLKPQPVVKPTNTQSDAKVNSGISHTQETTTTNQPKRHITDTQTAIPLPTTFPDPQMDLKSFLAFREAQFSQTKSTSSAADNLPFNYKFFEITLRKGFYGLPKKTKEYLRALGLTMRHQVVWRKVGPRSAGHILKVKELVSVRLMNEIPQKVVAPTGYKKVGSVIGQ
jgi:ribosomal protein L30/L7E